MDDNYSGKGGSYLLSEAGETVLIERTDAVIAEITVEVEAPAADPEPAADATSKTRSK